LTVKDLLYACGNVDKKTLITVIQATGKELVSQKKVSLFYELPESESILKRKLISLRYFLMLLLYWYKEMIKQ
jgi:hypothetical protein